MWPKAFRNIWMGKLLANLGDVFYIIALISIAYGISSSIFQMMMIPFFLLISRFIGSVITALILKRNIILKFITYFQLMKTILLILLFISTVHSSLSVIVLIATLVGIISGIISTTSTTLYPLIGRREEFAQTNGFLSTVDPSILVGGWLVGGFITSTFNPYTTLLMSIVCYLISIFFTYSIPKSLIKTSGEFNQRSQKGWKHLGQNKQMKIIHIVYGIEIIGGTVWFASFLHLFVGANEQWWGFINSAYFVGVLLGSMLIEKYQAFFIIHKKQILFLSTVFSAVVTILFSKSLFLLLAIILIALIGLLTQIKGVLYTAGIQKNAATVLYTGQAFTLLTASSILLTGWLLTMFRIQLIFFFSALLLVINSVLILTSYKEK